MSRCPGPGCTGEALRPWPGVRNEGLSESRCSNLLDHLCQTRHMQLSHLVDDAGRSVARAQASRD